LWVLLFFASALALFFVSSARYLLPMAAPVALLVSQQLAGKRHWLAAGFVIQLRSGLPGRDELPALGGVSKPSSRCVGGCAASCLGQRRVGLRFYAEAEGAVPLLEGQPVEPGDVVLKTDCLPGSIHDRRRKASHTGGTEVRPAIHSGSSGSARGPRTRQ
jgi:hypothetical protein